MDEVWTVVRIRIAMWDPSCLRESGYKGLDGNFQKFCWIIKEHFKQKSRLIEWLDFIDFRRVRTRILTFFWILRKD